METVRCETLVIGAGVIGLAVGARLASPNLILVDAHPGFGRETSSRNSEVIHSGINYPSDSNKTLLCLEGRSLLYAFLERHRVPFQKCGKVVVAASADEDIQLEMLRSHSEMLRVPWQAWDIRKLKAEEPLVHGIRALFFPESGIIDSHSFMKVLETQVLQRGGNIAYGHKVTRVASSGATWEVELKSAEGTLRVEADRVVNAAGLAAAQLSCLALQTRKFEHRFCRGRYFSLASNHGRKFRRLIYPMPQKDGLGVHVTLDLAGQVRLGPDVDWCADSDPSDTNRYYDCDWDSLVPAFVSAVRRYLHAVDADDLKPALCGIRPKLFIEGAAKPDFLIENHSGWIHCLGVESPGLTSSLAIAERVASL